MFLKKHFTYNSDIYPSVLRHFFASICLTFLFDALFAILNKKFAFVPTYRVN